MLGHGAGDGLVEAVGGRVAQHAAGLLDGVVQVQAQELVPGLVDDRGVLAAAEPGPPLDDGRQELRQLQGDLPPGRGEAGQVGHAPHEPALADGLTVGQVEDLPHGVGVLGGEEDPVDQVLDVDAVEGLLARPEVGERPAAEVRQQLGQDGAVALAVDEPGADDRDGEPLLLAVGEGQGLGLGLGAGVGVERVGGGRGGLVGAEVVAALVDAQRADVDEPPHLGRDGRVEQQPEGLDVQAAELGEGAPVADLGGAVEDPVGAGDAPGQGVGVLQVAEDLLHAPLVELAGVAGGADEGLDAVAAGQRLLDRVAADEAGRAGDEDGLGAGAHGERVSTAGAAPAGRARSCSRAGSVSGRREDRTPPPSILPDGRRGSNRPPRGAG